MVSEGGKNEIESTSSNEYECKPSFLPSFNLLSDAKLQNGITFMMKLEKHEIVRQNIKICPRHSMTSSDDVLKMLTWNLLSSNSN